MEKCTAQLKSSAMKWASVYVEKTARESTENEDELERMMENEGLVCCFGALVRCCVATIGGHMICNC